MDKLQAMATFVAVVDAGSFVGAMDTTGLSKPAVSRQVAELERLIGSRLLHRTTRSLSLTEDGRRYYERCKELLAAINDAENEAGQQVRQAHGRLRVGAPQDFGVEFLAPLWGQFLAQNPNVELDVVLSDRVMDLVEEGYDLVVRIGHTPNSSLVGRTLAHTRMLLCASPEYLASAAPLESPEDLAHHAVVAYSYFSTGDTWRLRDAQGREQAVRVHPRVHTSSGASCRALAVTGQGIILQPDFLLYRELMAGTLVPVLPQWHCNELTIQALYPTRTLVPVKVQRLRDFLVQALAAPPWSAVDTASLAKTAKPRKKR
ncbi:LysR family transcriptional regulator [Lampropedia puyangensis]|uniref:LysR family transcriptional regulator n=1 Tax=Lampropedia puyangensis TaxID=1330072 RepID=A0A4S8F022_9BURK|nr:LysR family transcriptional regulator [Lampropedia puyangensis]THU00219.1 LysR family transcriptional regulator [Lampropedia puyangensis]